MDIPWKTGDYIHGNTMVKPWNFQGQTPWVSMEFSYHFAHMKLPWFAHHGYSMENWRLYPWIFNGITMVGSPWVIMEFS